jgi:hypothetical protein
MKTSPKRIAALLALSLVAGFSHSAPCDQVNRSFTVAQAMDLSGPVSNQLAILGIRVQESYQFEGWTILGVKPKTSDTLFLFYPKDPSAQKFIAKWSPDQNDWDAKRVGQWLGKNTPSIPSELASCFVWHVTEELKKLRPTPECDCKKN